MSLKAAWHMSAATAMPVPLGEALTPGVFGMSTALWMLETGSGKYDVTILEKCTTVPAPDAASTGECRSERSERRETSEQ